MSQKPIVMKRDQWAKKPDQWHGQFEGVDLGGANVAVMFFSSDELGDGPALHSHPYDELFIIKDGNVRFTVDGQTIEAEAGDIIFAPAQSLHKFENVGPGRLVTTDIHCSDRIITTFL